MKGKFLIASPSIFRDPFFNRSVIYITEYNGVDGTVGFIVNKPSNLKVRDFVADLDCDFTVYRGGSVQQDNLYFIHNVPEKIPHSVHIKDNTYWGGDFKKLTELINTKSISEKNIRFFLGYSGWTVNQLEEELEEKSWVVSNDNYNFFEKKSKTFWRDYILSDDELKIWANSPRNPSLN